MPTGITPQTKAEIGTCLTTLAISCYEWGGKYETGFQAFQKLVMTKLTANSSSVQTRAPRPAASAPAVVKEQVPGRRRGRPPGQNTGAKNRARASKPPSEKIDAILRCVASGFSEQAAMIPELKRTYGVTIQPNHLGVALARLAKAKRLTKTGSGKTATWSSTAIGQKIAQAA